MYCVWRGRAFEAPVHGVAEPVTPSLMLASADGFVPCVLCLPGRRKAYDAKGKLVDRPAPAAKPAADQAASMSTS